MLRQSDKARRFAHSAEVDPGPRDVLAAATADTYRDRTSLIGYVSASVLVAATFLSRPVTGAGAPGIVNFAHFLLAASFAALIVPYIRSAESMRLVTGLLALLCALCLSALAGGAGIINVLLDYVLLAEPFLLLLLVIDAPFSSDRLRRFTFLLLGFAVLNVAIAYYQYFVMGYTNPDDVRGLFIGQGAGAHVAGGVAMATAALLVAAGGLLPLPVRILGAAAAGVVVIFTDSKQVALAAVVSAALLGLSKLKSPKRAFGYVALAALLSGGVYAAAQGVWPALRSASSLDRAALGFEHKTSIVGLTVSYYKSPLNWVFGLGPGHTVGRLGLLLPDYEQYLEPLGVTTSPVTETAITANYERLLARPGSGSSFWSVTSSWAGIWGDLGFVGLIVIGALWLIVWRHICADDLSRFLLLTVIILSFIYPWMEEPGYMIFVTAIIGLRFQEHRMQTESHRDARRQPPGYVAPRASG